MVRANPTAAGPCVEAGGRKVGIRDRGSAKPCESESKVYGSLTTDPGSRLDLFMAIYAIRFARHAGIIALFVVAAILGIATGVIFAYAGDLPQISALDDYAPSTITRVYGSHGEVVGEFSMQRREIVPYEAISPKLRQAIIAAEDSEFEQHFGLSMPHIVMAATRDILGAIRDEITGRRSRPKGASTITQQLARGLFPEAVGFQIGDVSLERKIKEALVAVQIEKRYTKREIFTLYANQMYLGEGAYGVEAASRTYFGKSAKDLTLDEAATIAGPLPDVAQCADRQHGPREAAPRLRARADGRGGLHHAQGSRRRQGAADRAGGGAGAPATRSRPTSSRKSARISRAGTARSSCTKTACRCRPRSTSSCRKRPIARWTTGLRRIDKRRGFRKPRRNVIAEGHTIDAFSSTRAGTARWRSATSCRRSSAATEGAAIVAHAGKLPGDDRQEGLSRGRARRPPRSSSRPAISSRRGC